MSCIFWYENAFRGSRFEKQVPYLKYDTDPFILWMFISFNSDISNMCSIMKWALVKWGYGWVADFVCHREGCWTLSGGPMIILIEELDFS